MKILLLILAIFAGVTFPSEAQEKGIKFEKIIDWQTVIADAKAKRKKIFVDAYATWCGPCKEMDSDVYPDSVLGKFMDSNYISIKIQLDSTVEDEEHIKAWRRDANMIRIKAKIIAFPTLLFFDEDGTLVYKSIGFQNANSLLKLSKFAANPALSSFNDDLMDYQNGIRDYAKMPVLTKMVRDVVGDKKLALEIAKTYKNSYLEKLTLIQFLNKENIEFIHYNGGVNLLNVNDHFFKTCYEFPDKLDSILGKGAAKTYLKAIISATVIKDHLYIDNKPIGIKPHWNKMEKDLIANYPKIKIDEIMLDEKVRYYKALRNWRIYSTYKTEQLKKYPPSTGGYGVFFGYNGPAWEIFEKSTDKVALRNALEWSELSIKLEKDNGNRVQYFDTKANLLYKLGKVKQAIISENEAIEASKKFSKEKKLAKVPFLQEFQENIEKMKRNQPTW